VLEWRRALAPLLLCLAAASAHASASSSTCRTMNKPSDAPIDQAVQRICAALPAAGPFALLIQSGGGAAAEAATKALRAALAKEPRIVLSSVERRTLPPVADPSAAAGHVNTESFAVQPPPRLVLRISEGSGKLYIAAREPGSDPLGPPDNGWLWVIEAPAR